MAKNDVILLDGIIEQRLSESRPSSRLDEVFEIFCLEEILKNYDLSEEELEFGWVDGRDDGGFDGVYVFINGHLLEDAEDFVWPKSHAEIDVWLVTCKHHDTFLQKTLDSLLATIQEIFDLGRDESSLHGTYSEDLLKFRSYLGLALKKLSIGRPTLNFKVVYASRGETNNVGQSVVARSEQIKAEIESLFSSCSVCFNFLGATELVESYRKAKTFSLELPFLEHLSTGKNSHVLLVKLEDYWRFVSDENGNLRRYLFDSNVRDYLGSSGVNEDIARSLADESLPDFWWLNNGVTILATNATVPGKIVQLQDIQIVNGLQTTETIYRHFQGGAIASRGRSLLVKIIVSNDIQTRDQIIRATNNQSPVDPSSLHATDKIQRDIEDILHTHDWYYERRKNYYRNIGKPQNRFVTPLYLASAVVSLILRNPHQATRIKMKVMRVQESYESIFSEQFPIEIWLILVNVYKSVDLALLEMVSAIPHRRERFTSTWRPLVSLITVARQLKTFSFGLQDLIKIKDKGVFKSSEIKEIFALITNIDPEYNNRKRMKPTQFKKFCIEIANHDGLSGVEKVGVQNLKISYGINIHHTEEYLDQVNKLLPAQPWKQGVHIEIARKLDCEPKMVSAAISQLMREGKKNMQRDGVVFDADGKIIAIDVERLNEGTSPQ